MSNFGFIRIATATPKLKPGNTEYNTQQIIECIYNANKYSPGILVFPELSLTGASCGDLFHQDFLNEKSISGLKQILEFSKGFPFAIVLGLHAEIDNNLLNCAAFIQGGELKGLTPKMFIPSAQARQFVSGSGFLTGSNIADKASAKIPFGNLLFKDSVSGVAIGIEMAEDINLPVTPGAILSLKGANIILNPAATPHTVGKTNRIRTLVLNESKKNICGYVYASAGVHESTADSVCIGQNIIAENGKLISESSTFNRDTTILYGDIDVNMLKNEKTRTQYATTATALFANMQEVTTVNLAPLPMFDKSKHALMRTYAKNPFVPDSPLLLAERCEEIFNMQCAGLAKRLEHTKSAKTVIGVSGGLDSTLALLVCAATHKMLGKNTRDILTITMPGFGTTNETYQNAFKLMGLLGTEIRDIPIHEAVLQHFRDINHDPGNRDVTYENSQARERTQILMDIANKESGIVIGTGDLSESALGWCTFNGDHMSMYNVNAGVPKTLIWHIIRWIIDYKLNGPHGEPSFSYDNPDLSYALEDILNTPISPELLPPDPNGGIVQKTEDFVGPYILNDFFIYYTVRHGFSPEKLLYIARQTFKGDYTADEIRKWLSVFYKRFFSQQFKRSCMPDGLKIGSISFDSHGIFKMPSDIDCSMWNV